MLCSLFIFFSLSRIHTWKLRIQLFAKGGGGGGGVMIVIRSKKILQRRDPHIIYRFRLFFSQKSTEVDTTYIYDMQSY